MAVNKVTFINNDGSGFQGEVEVPVGTTALEFFKLRMGASKNPNDYTIRRTRNSVKETPAGGDLVLHGDRYSILPKKVEGAEVEECGFKVA